MTRPDPPALKWNDLRRNRRLRRDKEPAQMTKKCEWCGEKLEVYSVHRNPDGHVVNREQCRARELEKVVRRFLIWSDTDHETYRADREMLAAILARAKELLSSEGSAR